jgi:hypothetical protein
MLSATIQPSTVYFPPANQPIAPNTSNAMASAHMLGFGALRAIGLPFAIGSDFTRVSVAAYGDCCIL